MSNAPFETEPAAVPEIRARARIRYCTQCRWRMRGAIAPGRSLGHSDVAVDADPSE
jgi:predicted Rdx family selenoprotein